MVLGLDDNQIKDLLKNFNYESSELFWSQGGNNTDFSNMVYAGMVIGAGFVVDGGAG